MKIGTQTFTALTQDDSGTIREIGEGQTNRDQSITLWLWNDPVEGQVILKPYRRRALWRRIGDAVKASEILSLRFGRHP